MIINVGNKFNLILVVCAASCFFFFKSLRMEKAKATEENEDGDLRSACSSGRSDSTRIRSKWILLSDGLNLFWCETREKSRLLTHSTSQLPNSRSNEPREVVVNLITSEASNMLSHYHSLTPRNIHRVSQESGFCYISSKSETRPLEMPQESRSS